MPLTLLNGTERRKGAIEAVNDGLGLKEAVTVANR